MDLLASTITNFVNAAAALGLFTLVVLAIFGIVGPLVLMINGEAKRYWLCVLIMFVSGFALTFISTAVMGGYIFPIEVFTLIPPK